MNKPRELNTDEWTAHSNRELSLQTHEWGYKFCIRAISILSAGPLLCWCIWNTTTPMHWLVKIFGRMLQTVTQLRESLGNICLRPAGKDEWLGRLNRAADPYYFIVSMLPVCLRLVANFWREMNCGRPAAGAIQFGCPLPVGPFVSWFQLGSINLSRWKWCGYLLFG